LNKEKKCFLRAAICLLAAFALWTAIVCFVDVQPIGPMCSSVGLATLNSYFHALTGVHLTLYALTDRLSLIPLFAAAGFALLGLMQWICRKSLRAVDRSLLVLGGFYVSLLAAYVVFEYLVVNCRPVLIGGILEASYPSSTIMLSIGIMSTSILQLRRRIRNKSARNGVLFMLWCFMVFMVVGRLLSGVHWLSDIVGGALLSTGLVMLYGMLASK